MTRSDRTDLRPTARRRAALLAATALAAALAAGCTADGPADRPARPAADAGPGLPGPEGEPTTPPPTTPPPTTPPPTTPPPTTPPPTTPPAAPTRTAGPGEARPVAVPASVMLVGTDWPGGAVRTARTGLTGLEQTEPSACQRGTAFPSDPYRLAARTVAISSGEPESGGVRQTVVRYAPGRATQAMAEARRVLAACRGYRKTLGSQEWQVRYAPEAERFAGDDALLVRVGEQEEGLDRVWSVYVSVVRLGDAVVTTVSELGEGVASREVALRLAATGARRAACLRDSC